MFKRTKMQDFFQMFAGRISRLVGSIWALMVLVIVTVASGWFFNFSVQWEERYSLALAVATLVFVIFLQNSQNHSDKATHLKLDELIKASEKARDGFAAAEMMAQSDLEKLKKQ